MAAGALGAAPKLHDEHAPPAARDGLDVVVFVAHEDYGVADGLEGTRLRAGRDEIAAREVDAGPGEHHVHRENGAGVVVVAVPQRAAAGDAVVPGRGERYATRHVRAGADGGAADASEETKAREGYAPGETKWSRGGATSAVRKVLKITCPFCNTADVHLSWFVSPISVSYQHRRSCNGKSKTQALKIIKEEDWREFLHELDWIQFDKHKADVLREIDELPTTR